MNVRILFLVSLLLTTSCIPLWQEEHVGGSNYPDLSLYRDQYVLVDVNLNIENIIVESSYILDPKGTKYGVLVEPHQYDIEQKFPAIRADVYPVKENGTVLTNWKSGIWTFHFQIHNLENVHVAEQKKKYWKFYYSPLIHGPPN